MPSQIENFFHLSPLPPPTTSPPTSAVFTTGHTSLYHPPGAPRIWGGLLVAHSLLAAWSTISPTPSSSSPSPSSSSLSSSPSPNPNPNPTPDLIPHSLHTHFLAPGAASDPVQYSITPLRDTRSFATRLVTGRQGESIISLTTVSFTKRIPAAAHMITTKRLEEEVVSHQPAMPVVAPPEKVLGVEDAARALGASEEEARAHGERDGTHPFEWRRLPLVSVNEGGERGERGGGGGGGGGSAAAGRVARSWVRARGGKVEGGERARMAALAASTDAWFVGTIARVNYEDCGVEGERVGMMVSLDHGVWFHAEIGEEDGEDESDDDDAEDRWWLVEMRSEWAGQERGCVELRMWRRRDGLLVATARQEGLVRLRPKGEEGRPLGLPPVAPAPRM